MQIEEFYNQIHGDYEEVKKLLLRDSMISHFVIAFLDEPTFGELEKAMAEDDMAKAFSAAHALKGVAANISFTTLSEKAGAVTECLRNVRDVDRAKGLFEDLKSCYESIVDMIRLYKTENDI